MNRFLANMLEVLNPVIAIIIVIVGILAFVVAVPSDAAFERGGRLPAMVISVTTFVLIVLVCGSLAVMVDIRNSLRQILEEVKKETPRAEPAETEQKTTEA